MKLIFIVSVVMSLSVNGLCQSVNKRNLCDTIKLHDNNYFYDTSKVAIFKYHKNELWPFNNSYRPAQYNRSDFEAIDSFFKQCVFDYNNRIRKDRKYLTINLEKRTYQKQLIFVTNARGERIVWVNCFCGPWPTDYWKTQIVAVDDGGNCFFNFKVNLTTHTYFELMVNGYI
jgi:hypothetical protein